MSLILEKIDLPKGQSLIVFIANNGSVVCLGKDGATTTQAIQISKGHENLKDENALAEIMAKELVKIANEKESISKSARLSLIRHLALKFEAAPTILKGE